MKDEVYVLFNDAGEAVAASVSKATIHEAIEKEFPDGDDAYASVTLYIDGMADRTWKGEELSCFEEN